MHAPRPLGCARRPQPSATRHAWPGGEPAGQRPAQNTRPVSLGLAALTLATLAACGGGGGGGADTGTTQVTVRPSLGAVFNADVSLTCAPTGAVLATGSTGSSGLVSLSTPETCTGPVLVRVSARADGTSTYYDEALGTTLTYPAGQALRAVAANLTPTLQIGVTALTEIATRQALATAGSLAALTAAQVNSANAAVAPQVLGTALDILTPPTPWTASTAAGSLGTSTADRYAYYLAALASMAPGEAAPALAVAQALATDLADGSLDGATQGGFSYTSANLAAQLGTGMSALRNYANSALQGQLGLGGPVSVSGFSPASGAVGDTITLTGSGFDPDLFHMQVKFSNNLSAEILESSPTQIKVKVPAGAVSGPITVIHGLSNQQADSSTSFTVTGGGGGGGNTWVLRTSPSSFLLNGLAWGNGRFVAVGFGKALLTSTDGLSWTPATAPDNNYYEAKSVIWTGSQFVMVGDKNYGSAIPALIATSPDGLTWTRRTWNPTLDYETLADVGVGGGKLTVVGMNGLVASSTDGGQTWTNDSTSPHVISFSGVAGNDSTRVAVGRDTSYNGAILVDTGSGWARVSGLTGLVPRDVIWAGTQFVAVGGSRAGIGDPVIATSPDGVTWTQHALTTAEAPSGYTLTTVLAQGGTLYATGDNFSNKHIIVQSTDAGATWTLVHEAQVNGNAMLAGMASSGSRIVTVGGVKSVTLP